MARINRDCCWWCEYLTDDDCCEFGVHPDDCEYLIELEEEKEK